MEATAVVLDHGSEMTEEHKKLLYLISLYSSPTSSDGALKELWVGQTSLLVLLYEGIVAKVFDYDFAPASIALGSRRVYVNISQEGRDDIDDLLEMKLIFALKLSHSEHQSITAYRINDDGLQALQHVSLAHRALVDGLVRPASAGDLLQVRWEEARGEFVLHAPGGFSRVSTITDCEDVSYVSSPYLPIALRRGGRPTRSFADRAAEAALGEHNLRDELDEAIVLGHVTILIGEWIPFGANQIVALNDKLGSLERVQGGFFTAQTAPDMAATQFEFEPGLTSVQILDFHVTRFLNFEAEVFYPEEPGIVQVENFGIHIHRNGTVVYGLRMESVMDRLQDHMSVDHLARVLVDIQQDSSKIMNSLISSYQRALLDLVFCDDASNRNKFNLLIADAITPKMPAERYMDKEVYENELKQVLGAVHSAHDLDEHTVLIRGQHGALVAGGNARKFESSLLAFLALMGLEIFVHQFFGRAFMLSEDLQRVRSLIENHERDPTSIHKIRRMLSQTSKCVILVEELRARLEDALHRLDPMRDYGAPTAASRHGGEPVAAHVADTQESLLLTNVINVQEVHEDLRDRVLDLANKISALRNELQSLRELADVISESRTFRMQEVLCANTKNLEDMFRSNERASSSLEVMQVILSGTLAFDILDRVTGEWSIMDTWWGSNYILQPLVHTPGLWFIINIALWCSIALALMAFMRDLTDRGAAVLTWRHKCNVPVNLRALQSYLLRKPIEEEDLDSDRSVRIKKVAWDEPPVPKWRGRPPHVEVQFDQINSYLLQVFFQVSKGASVPDVVGDISGEEVKSLFFAELREAGVFDVANGPPADALFEDALGPDATEQLSVEDVASARLFHRGAQAAGWRARRRRPRALPAAPVRHAAAHAARTAHAAIAAPAAAVGGQGREKVD